MDKRSQLRQRRREQQRQNDEIIRVARGKTNYIVVRHGKDTHHDRLLRR